MKLDDVPCGENVPDEFHVVIEVPSHSEPVKYETDKTTGAMFVDRFLGTAMHYPYNYGYIPQTLSPDGDPVDVMVLAPAPVITGAVVRCRPLGILQMSDEAGDDAKVLAVPVTEACKLYEGMRDYRDLHAMELERIAHFFQHYKDLDEGRWVRVAGWGGLDEARAEILEGVRLFREAAR